MVRTGKRHSPVASESIGFQSARAGFLHGPAIDNPSQFWITTHASLPARGPEWKVSTLDHPLRHAPAPSPSVKFQ
jgi:hypothetical protein